MESIAATEGAEANVSKDAVSSNAHTCDGSTAPYPYNPIIETLGTTGTVVNGVSIAGSQACGKTSSANNKLFGSKFYRMTPSNSGNMTVTATDTGTSTTEDPDVYIFQRGTTVKICNAVGSDTCTTAVTAGTVYIVEIRTFSCVGQTGCGNARAETSTITITLP